MRVAIQGEKGSFSHEAALRLAPDLTDLQCCALSSQVFEQLTAGKADAAVVPIENSLAGSVLEHYDLLLAHPVSIEAELLLRIRHQLIAAPGVPLSAIREVYSHPVALAQCRNFFSTNPRLRGLPFYDTAGSAAHAVQAGRDVAGIASEQAAREYGGEILVADIEDHAQNYTRFLLLRPAPGRQGAAAAEARLETGGVAPAGTVTSGFSGANKVSLAFAVPNHPGSLVSALQIFASHGLNLCRLESRPVPGTPWEYVFYADYQLEDLVSAEHALLELSRVCSFVKELGRYRAAPPVTLARESDVPV